MAVLQVTPRESTGHAAKHLRKAGWVPMALFQKPDHSVRLIQAPILQVRQAVAGAHGVGMIDIHIEGESKPRSVIVKQVDQDYMTHRLNNVTLMEVSRDDLITADIGITHVGTPSAVDDGIALLSSPTSTIKIKGKVSELPDHFEVDLSGLELGGHIVASDIPLPEGIELISPPDTLLFGLTIAKEPELEAPAEEGAGEPEVVGEDGESPGEEGS
ncbi:MAG: 50S ribosomal protein L25 [Fimbriimonadaceae bacterium]